VPLIRLKLITTEKHATRRLDEALAHWLTGKLERPVSKAKARKLIMAGAARIDGRIVRIASQTLSSGTRIECAVDVTRLFDDATSRDRKFELSKDRILFEDDDLIVVDKPSGLPAHPTADEDRDNLVAAISRFLTRRDGIAQPYIGVHHRLDRDTSGVALFTKSRRVNAAVGETFSERRATKVYQALTIAAPTQKEWTITNYLGKVSSQAKRARYGAVRSDGQFAETAFRVIARRPRGLWVEAIPRTGRTHQIRAHLSEYGLPILGDDLYGDAAKASRLMLHASELIFPHPITGREISVKSPLPDDFEQCWRDLL
jgi:RluA family pseudouridine synthase